MKCSNCESTDFRRNGFRKNKITKERIQRYKCKQCGKTQSKHSVTYAKTEKDMLSLLINFLEIDLNNLNDLGDLNLKEFLKNSKGYRHEISNIVIKAPKEVNPFGYRTEYEVKCSNPRLLICGNKNSIKLIKIPRGITKKCKKSFNFIVG